LKIYKITPALPVLLIALGSIAHAQYFKDHAVSISVGATSPFDHQLTSHPTTGTYTIPTPAGGDIDTTVSNQTTSITDSAGFLTSIQFHPRSWAGVELNYGFNHYARNFDFTYSAANTAQSLEVKQDVHEFTGALQFHSNRKILQPFVSFGTGALDFDPRNLSNQIRGAGLLEAGIDAPTYKGHIGFRFEGRALFFRAPNFYQPAISPSSWRASMEPSISTFYRF
jgi:hypothetical protein